jgi:enoyl-CoA hydratase/carnithine racemase
MAPPKWIHDLAKNTVGHHSSKLLQLGSTLNWEESLRVGLIDRVVEDIDKLPETTDFSALALDDPGKILHQEAMQSIF